MESAVLSIDGMLYSFQDEKIAHILKKKIDLKIPISFLKDATRPFLSLEGMVVTTGKEGVLMHRKIVVIDELIALIGSANMTRTSLRLDDNLVLGFYNKELALAMKHLQKIETQIGTTAIAFFPTTRKEALSSLLSLLNTSQTSIKVAMFSLTHPALIEALINAHKRDVSVEVIIDKKGMEGAGHLPATALLEAGVSLFLSSGPQTFHHKCALIDDTTFVLGSANWTKNAFTKNEECLLILSPLPAPLIKKMHRFWHASFATAGILKS